jgi:hypothetical protein
LFVAAYLASLAFFSFTLAGSFAGTHFRSFLS